MAALTASQAMTTRMVHAGDALRVWWPDVVLGMAVIILDAFTVGGWDPGRTASDGLLPLLVTVGMAVATGAFRLAPGLALALVWLTSVLQVAGGQDIAPVQLFVMVVAFGAARYGSTATVWASAISIPVGAAAALGYAILTPDGGLGRQLVDALRPMDESVPVASGLTFGFLLAAAGLALPWTLGLALRLRGRAQRSAQQRLVAEADRNQAEEIARLREGQTQLARDVHDVVGHSLAVILAQAESAQYRPDTDTAAVRATLANIAGSARKSLQDVRHVLSSTDGTAPAGRITIGSLDALLDGVVAAGNDVRSTVVGDEQPLPPELDVVAFRILQEMLTNALRHGRRDRPVLVERRWDDGLRIEVVNLTGPDPLTPAVTAASEPLGPTTSGRGIDGMRRRLESVGGRLQTHVGEGPGGVSTFTATAWLPVRVGAR